MAVDRRVPHGPMGRAQDGPGLSRRLLMGGVLGGFLCTGRAHAQGEALPVSAQARQLLASLPGKAVMGAQRVPPLVTEFVDFNAPDWRRSAADMRELLAGDGKLACAVVQAPRLDITSVEAARVALAVLALHPTRFEAFYDALARTEGRIDGVKALNVVRAEGLDHYKVFRASNQPDVTESLTRAVELASALKLLDTPAYVIGNSLWAGYLDLARKRALIAAART